MTKKLHLDIKNIPPLQQGVFILLLVSAFSIGCLVFGFKGVQAWNLILSPLFLYCFYNPVIGAFHQKPLQYAGESALIFCLLGGFIYVSGSFISDFSYGMTVELHWMTALVILFYILLSFLSQIFRGILYLLEQIDQ